MERVTQRAIRKLVDIGVAHSLDDLDWEGIREADRRLKPQGVLYSSGNNGISAFLFVSCTDGELYAVTNCERSRAFFGYR